jgi:hypothetical protein
MVAHSAEGEMLICHVVDGSSVLGVSATRPTTTTVKPVVKDATTTRTSSDSLPLTGARSMTTALIALMVLSAGVVLWGRATKKEYDRNWVARHAEPYRPVPPRHESDDRWHW